MFTGDRQMACINKKIFLIFTLFCIQIDLAISNGNSESPPGEESSVDPSSVKGSSDSDSGPGAEAGAKAGAGRDGAGGADKKSSSENKDIPILEYEIELETERNLLTDFQFKIVSTSVSKPWKDLPEIKDAKIGELRGSVKCKGSLVMSFMNYKNRSRTLCLYKDTSWGEDVEAEINVGRTFMDAHDLVDDINPVRGFVVKEINSLVKGYLINGNFFGHVRIFDNKNGYHIHFYIEPSGNVKDYGGSEVEDGDAIMFEFVSHEDRQSGPKTGSERTHRKVSEGKAISKREAPEQNLRKKRDTDGKGDQDSSDDIFETLSLEPGISTMKIFDTSYLKSFLCPVCVWIQPNFAVKFGLGAKQPHGIAEVLNILTTADWILRSIDFNGDNNAENFGLKIKRVLVSDEIDPNKGNKRRRKRDYADGYLNFDYYEDWGDGHHGRKNFHRTWKRQNTEQTDTPPSETEAEVSQNVDSADPPPSDSETAKQDPESTNHSPSESKTDAKGFKKDVHTINAKEAYKTLLDQLQGKFKDCCAIIAFVYHNLAPVISISSMRGLCSSANLVVVSGLIHENKIGVYDVLRGLLHGLGHLMGASHEKSVKVKCTDRKPSTFINPYLMHPSHQLNVGARPNSFRLSDCVKAEVVSYLMSQSLQPDCFENEKQSFCGNGMAEDSEECDCGSVWQCPEQACCGERDTVFGCKTLRTGRRLQCERPQRW